MVMAHCKSGRVSEHVMSHVAWRKDAGRKNKINIRLALELNSALFAGDNGSRTFLTDLASCLFV